MNVTRCPPQTEADPAAVKRRAAAVGVRGQLHRVRCQQTAGAGRARPGGAHQRGLPPQTASGRHQPALVHDGKRVRISPGSGSGSGSGSGPGPGSGSGPA